VENKDATSNESKENMEINQPQTENLLKLEESMEAAVEAFLSAIREAGYRDVEFGSYPDATTFSVHPDYHAEASEKVQQAWSEWEKWRNSLPKGTVFEIKYP
jgi:hypothetical protein